MLYRKGFRSNVKLWWPKLECRGADLIPNCLKGLSPYLTGLRLFCDSSRQTSRVGRKAVSKQSPVIRNFLACVAKWRKVVAKILNMFKNFMRQNSSQIVAKSSRVSRNRHELVADPSQFSRNHFGTQNICEIIKTKLRINCDINETLRDDIASKLN